MANLLFIVSRSRPRRHLYGHLKQIYADETADETRDVVLDRRKDERRRSLMLLPQVERRQTERRCCDITHQLESSGCALVRRLATRTA
jgi:hypothetical protein